MSRQNDIHIAHYLFGWNDFDGEVGINPSGNREVVPHYTSDIVDALKVLDKVARFRIEKKGGNLTHVTLWLDSDSAFGGRGFDLVDAISSCLMIWINRKLKDEPIVGCNHPDHQH